VAFGDLARLPSQPKETLQGNNQKKGRRDDTQNSILKGRRKVERARARNDSKPSIGWHFGLSKDWPNHWSTLI
jgi:hypothetical protein